MNKTFNIEEIIMSNIEISQNMNFDLNSDVHIFDIIVAEKIVAVVQILNEEYLQGSENILHKSNDTENCLILIEGSLENDQILDSFNKCEDFLFDIF